MDKLDINSSLDISQSEFRIYVFVAYDATDIRGVVLDNDYIVKIKKLAAEMKTYYNCCDSEPDIIEEGKYYAIFDEQWYRVRCLSCDYDSNSAVVLFIDRGDEDVYPIESLQNLDKKFLSLPAQSIKLSMNNLEIFNDCMEVQVLEDLLVEKEVFVNLVEIRKENDDTLILLCEFFLEKGTKEEQNVNELLLEELFRSVLDPKGLVGTDKPAQQACISYLDENVIFMQIKSKGLIHLKTLMNNLSEQCLNNKYYVKQKVSEFDLTKIYVIKNKENGNWCRIKVFRIKNENEAEVKFIDIGNDSLVQKQNLFLLENLSELLTRYPEQALQVKLHKISPFTYDNNMVAHLRQLTSNNDIFYVKVVSDLEQIPMVQICKRTDDNCLISINDTLILKSSLIDHQLVLPLHAPEIPEENSYFDVFIIMASRPDNIIVQPLSSLNDLENLMNDLLDNCESFSGPHLTSNCVKVGGLYAAQNDADDEWYRSCVYKILNKKTFAIYDCDYGVYRVVPLKNLQPLPKKFHDLPYQAIKAKIDGATPALGNNWTEIDYCRLNELTLSKSFVACIKNREINEASLTKVVLNLELIDTSTDEDIYIIDILNNEKKDEPKS